MGSVANAIFGSPASNQKQSLMTPEMEQYLKGQMMGAGQDIAGWDPYRNATRQGVLQSAIGNIPELSDQYYNDYYNNYIKPKSDYEMGLAAKNIDTRYSNRLFGSQRGYAQDQLNTQTALNNSNQQYGGLLENYKLRANLQPQMRMQAYGMLNQMDPRNRYDAMLGAKPFENVVMPGSPGLLNYASQGALAYGIGKGAMS